MLQWPGELSQRIVNLTMIVLQRQVCRLIFWPGAYYTKRCLTRGRTGLVSTALRSFILYAGISFPKQHVDDTGSQRFFPLLQLM